VMIDGNTAIEFRYDNEKAARGGMDIGPFSIPEDRPWNSYDEGIYSVIFDQSFANCTSITSTAFWFNSFHNLDYIGGLEYLNTSNVTDMRYMFNSCNRLTSLDVSNFNTSNVTDMWAMFGGCNSLTSLDVSNFNTSKVTLMFAMFAGCSNLTSLNLSNFNTSNVTNMDGMFESCSSLTAINVGEGWNISNVREDNGIFLGCTNLVGGAGTTYDSSHTGTSYAHIDGGSSNPGYLTGEGGGSGEEAQYWMELRSTLDYALDVQSRAQGHPNVEPWMQEELAMMIERGSNMYDEHTAEEEEVRHMIEELSWICMEIEEAMNRGQSGEPEAYAALSENNTILTFYYDDQKESRNGMDVGPFTITWEQIDSTYYQRVDSGWDEYREIITKVVFDDSFADCSTITSTAGWFLGFVSLDSINGLEHLNTALVTDMQYMFKDCSNLTEIDVSHFDTSNVTNMTSMFENCKKLARIDVSNFNTSNVNFLDIMFSECEELTSIDVSNFNTSNVVSMGFMFSGCTKLTSIDVSHFETSNVTYMAGMFQMCQTLQMVDVSNFNTSNVRDMTAMFNGCGRLTSLDLSSFNTSNVSDMSMLFGYCWNLSTLDLSHFNTSNVTDMHMMFTGCSSLNTIYVDIENWSTARVSSGGDMFSNCTNLVGGSGTTWSQNHINVSYAHVDGGQAYPGYLTDINGRVPTPPTPVPVESEARFDGLTAWVYGDATLDDAFAEVGRESAVQTIAAIVWEGTGALTAEQMQGITNPNLLVYVNEASKAPAGVQNVIVNGTAAQIVLTDASGNNNFFCPEPFTAQSISYTRNFSQTTEIGVSRGWETIALPFNVQSISHGSHGALVPFGGGNGGYPFWLHQLQDNGLTPVTAMEANTPYLICMPNNTVYPSAYNQAGSVTFASSNVTVPRTEPREAFGANVILMPAFQNQPAGPDIFTLNVGAARDSYAEGSVFISNYSDVRPFQAYVRHSSQARGTDDIQFIPLTSIGGGDDTTAIMEIIQPAANGTGDWYSLDGRKLSSKPTQKGVYIQNGKKIVIK